MAAIYIAPTRLDAACTFARVFQTASALLQARLDTPGPVHLSAELQLTHVEDAYEAIVPEDPFVWRKPTLELLWVDVELPGTDPFSVMLRCEQFSSGAIAIADIEEGCGRTLKSAELAEMRKSNTYWSIPLPKSASDVEARTHHVLAEAIAEVCGGCKYVQE